MLYLNGPSPNCCHRARRLAAYDFRCADKMLTWCWQVVFSSAWDTKHPPEAVIDGYGCFVFCCCSLESSHSRVRCASAYTLNAVAPFLSQQRPCSIDMFALLSSRSLFIVRACTNAASASRLCTRPLRRLEGAPRTVSFPHHPVLQHGPWNDTHTHTHIYIHTARAPPPFPSRLAQRVHLPAYRTQHPDQLFHWPDLYPILQERPHVLVHDWNVSTRESSACCTPSCPCVTPACGDVAGAACLGAFAVKKNTFNYILSVRAEGG